MQGRKSSLVGGSGPATLPPMATRRTQRPATAKRTERPKTATKRPKRSKVEPKAPAIPGNPRSSEDEAYL